MIQRLARVACLRLRGAPSAAPSRSAAAVGSAGEFLTSVRDLLDGYVEMAGELLVGSGLHCRKLIRGDERGAGVVLAAAGDVACRVAGELAGSDVARVKR